MRLQWIGDALDHWKGGVLEVLQAREVWSDFCVDPMATDIGDWLPSDFAIYADLLRVDPDRVVRHEKTLDNRDGYFGELPNVQDVFLDPDTGIATGRVKNPSQYVRSQDIWRQMCSGRNRMVAVYQHVRAIKTSVRVDQVVSHVDRPEQLCWCSYESGTVAMLFFSLARHRIEAVEGALVDKLGRHGARRVRTGLR